MNLNFDIKPDERLDDLQRNGLFILQKTKGFRFGLDAVILSDFAQIRPHDRVADLGTGTGILPLLLYGREPSAVFDAVELQKEMADAAARSVRGNGLEGKITVHCHDVRSIRTLLPSGAYSLVVCNPPYEARDDSRLPETAALRTAKTETECTLADVARAAKWLLKNGGRLCLCLPPKRMAEAFETLKDARIEPKRLRLVHSRADRPAWLMLLEGYLNGRPGLTVMPPLIVRDSDGQDSAEIKRIYQSDEGEPIREEMSSLPDGAFELSLCRVRMDGGQGEHRGQR